MALKTTLPNDIIVEEGSQDLKIFINGRNNTLSLIDVIGNVAPVSQYITGGGTNGTSGTAGTSGNSASVNTGVLQVTGGVALDATLRNITDQSGNATTLDMSTSFARLRSKLNIVTDDDFINADDALGNDRFALGRNSQTMEVRNESNPTPSPTTEGTTIFDFQGYDAAGGSLESKVKITKGGSIAYKDSLETIVNSATTDVNLGSGNIQVITLGASTAITFTFAKSGIYTLIVQQDGTGGYAVTWSNTIRWTNGTAPTITTTANKADIITITYDGSEYYGQYTQNH